MRRNNDEFINEVFHRSGRRIAQRNRRRKIATGCISMGLCAAIMIMIRIPEADVLFPIDGQEGIEQEDSTNNSAGQAESESDSIGDESDLDVEIGTTYPGDTDDEAENSDGMNENNGDDCVDGNEEEMILNQFRDMEIISIEGNVVTLVDESGYTVIYWMTENGIYDVAKEEYLELSQAEKEFWEIIFSTGNKE